MEFDQSKDQSNYSITPLVKGVARTICGRSKPLIFENPLAKLLNTFCAHTLPLALIAAKSVVTKCVVDWL